MRCGLNPLLTSLIPMDYRSLNRVALAAGLMDAMIYLGSALSGVFAGFLSDAYGWGRCSSPGPCSAWWVHSPWRRLMAAMATGVKDAFEVAKTIIQKLRQRLL